MGAMGKDELHSDEGKSQIRMDSDSSAASAQFYHSYKPYIAQITLFKYVLYTSIAILRSRKAMYIRKG